MVSRPQQVSAVSEEMLDEPMYRRETLHMGGRLEASHLLDPHENPQCVGSPNLSKNARLRSVAPLTSLSYETTST